MRSVPSSATGGARSPHARQGARRCDGKVAAQYPGDSEATILYALITSVNFDPADKQYRTS